MENFDGVLERPMFGACHKPSLQTLMQSSVKSKADCPVPYREIDQALDSFANPKHRHPKLRL